MNELCQKCLPFGYCEFERDANELAKKQVSSNGHDPKTLMCQAISVHTEISDRRIEARKNGCPNINNIDPNYPGKNLL